MPTIVDKKIGDVDYRVLTPDRRKSRRICHINMMKRYYDRENSNQDAESEGAVTDITDKDVATGHDHSSKESSVLSYCVQGESCDTPPVEEKVLNFESTPVTPKLQNSEGSID